MSVEALDRTAAMSGKTGITRWIPWIFASFFGVILAANATMIYIALSSWTGLETKNHYIKGRDYNDTLARVEAQAALGWAVETRLESAGAAGSFNVSLTLDGANGEGLTGAEVVVRFERPTHHGIDQSVRMTEVRPGLYVGSVTLQEPGQWNLRRLVWLDDATHQTLERTFVKAEYFE